MEFFSTGRTPFVKVDPNGNHPRMNPFDGRKEGHLLSDTEIHKDGIKRE